MPFLCLKKNAFFCICPDITYPSELYKRLGGTGSVVEAFHSSAAPLLAQEAFRSEVLAPRHSCRGLSRVHGQSQAQGTPQWPQPQGKQKQISLHLFFYELEFGCQGSGLQPPGSFFTHSKETFSKSRDGEAICP